MTEKPYDENKEDLTEGDLLSLPTRRSELDPDSDIILAFLGQLAFCYKPDPDGYYEIGVNNKAGRHELSIVVYEYTADSRTRRTHWYPDDNQPDTPSDIQFEVNNPVEPGVFYYGHEEIFNRSTSTDKLDFRWAIDFEGPDFYVDRLDKKGGNISPRLQVKNGTFFTVKTDSTFDLYDSQGPRPFGSVGRIIGANIYLNDGGFATFTIDGRPWRLEKKPNTTYLILFSYDCDGRRCEWNPAGLSKYERNDFYLYYRTFYLREGQEEIELIKSSAIAKAQESTTQETDATLAPKFIDLFGKFKIRSNDEAPCGGNGFFGKSTSLG